MFEDDENLGEKSGELYFDSEDYIFDDVKEEIQQSKSTPRDEISECEICGKEFSQGYSIDKKTGEIKVNKYKRCQECRKNTKVNSQTKDSKQVIIKYDPYPWQRDFHNSKAIRKVVSGAARTGKDRSATMEFISDFILMLNEERRDHTFVPKVHGWIIAPTYKLAGQLMREVFNTFPRDLVVDFVKDEYAIHTINGGLIEFRSADDPDSLVSVGLDIVWITEAARIKDFDVVIGNIEDRLSSPGRGYNSQGGFLLVNSSPRGRTYFNTICKFGNKNSSMWRPNWETFYVSRWDNPYFSSIRNKYICRTTGRWELDEPERPGDRTYEQDLKLSRSDRQYNEDILGQPSDEEGTQFPNFRDNAVIEKTCIENLEEFKKELKIPKPDHIYTIGYDPAKQIDGAWVVVYDVTDGKICEFLKMEKVNYKVQIKIHVADLVKKWNYAKVYYGKTGVGEALEPFFMEAGLDYEAIPEQGKNKERLVENLSTIIKEGKLKIYNVDDTSEEAIRQYEDYGYSTTDKGNITFSNMTKGFHDDAVSASYFAVSDVELQNIEEQFNTFSDDSISIANNRNTNIGSMAGGFC